MKTKLFAAIIPALCFIIAAPAFAKDSCPKGEQMESSVPDRRPEWADKPYLSLGKEKIFVGIATQNEKLESAIEAAVENANEAIFDAIGKVLQTKSEGVFTLGADDYRRSLGSRGATAYLKGKERRAVYYERWASYERCRPKKYHYNVWVQVAVPSGEIEAESAKAMEALKALQQKENSNGSSGLLPSSTASHISDVPSKKFEPLPAVVPEPIVAETPKYYYDPYIYPFRCSSIGIQGGYTRMMNSVETDLGKYENPGFNVSFDGEGAITPNVCMGGGMGYATIKRDTDAYGHIVPFYLRTTFKFPVGVRRWLVFWLGNEMGPAIIRGFKLNDPDWSGERKEKTQAAFWVGGMAGVDVRVQKSLTITINAGYFPVISSKTYNLLLARVGIRYYFWK